MMTMVAITNTTNTNTLTHHVESHPPPLNTIVPNLTTTGLETCMGYFFFFFIFY